MAQSTQPAISSAAPDVSIANAATHASQSSTNNHHDSKIVKTKQPVASFLQIAPRRSDERGHGHSLSWLNSYHTFSFASYSDQKFNNFHSLRVINEDRVAGSSGFATHSHDNYEIFSYIISGAIRHRDSIQNDEHLGRGYVQFTSAGTGISHSEYNASETDLLHFLQMWVKPSKLNLKPNYQTKYFDDSEKKNALRLIVSPDAADNVITINQDVRVYASLLDAGQVVSLPVASADREYYVHVADDVTGFDTQTLETGVTLNDEVALSSGDGAFLTQQGAFEPNSVITFKGASSNPQKPVEFVVFDISKHSTI